MIPDILGHELQAGIELLKKYGIHGEDLIIKEYTSPKKDIIGNEKRILRIDKECGKLTIVVGNF